MFNPSALASNSEADLSVFVAKHTNLLTRHIRIATAAITAAATAATVPAITAMLTFFLLGLYSESSVVVVKSSFEKSILIIVLSDDSTFAVSLDVSELSIWLEDSGSTASLDASELSI